MDVEASVEKYREVVEVADIASSVVYAQDCAKNDDIKIIAFKAILDELLIKLSEEESKECSGDDEESNVRTSEDAFSELVEMYR